MTTTETTEAARLRRWAHLHGYDTVQAQAIATDPAAHRAALTAWFTDRGLDPAHAQEEATPPDPVTLAELEAWELPQRAPSIDPEQFAREERVSVAEFAQRTGKDRSTLSKAVNNPAYRGEDAAVRVPERGADRRYNAPELAEFVASLPGRRGRQAKGSG